MHRRTLGTLTWFLLTAAGLAHAEIFVGTVVTDTSAAKGTEANPYLDFKSAATKAASTGEDVTVLAGNYAGQNITASGTADNQLVINARPGAYILNDGSLSGGVIKSDGLNISGSYVTVNGLNIRGNSTNADISMDSALANIFVKDGKFNTNGVVVESTHVTVSNCVITNTTGSGMRIQGQTATPTDYVTFSGNVVANCGWYTPVGSGAGIVVAAIKPADTSTDAKIVIQGNMVYACQGRLVSNVDSKNFATLAIDEGQGIMLTRIDTYTSGKVLVDNNVVMYSGSKAISSQYGDGTIVSNNTTYMDGTTGTSDPTPVLINKTPNSVVQNNLLVTYDRNNGVALMGTTAEKNSVTVSGNVIVGQDTAIFGAGTPGASLVKVDGAVTAGADNATVASLQTKLAEAGINQGQPAQTSWFLSTEDLYRQQVNFMMRNGTNANNGTIRLSRQDPAGTRQYPANYAGVPPAEVLGVARPDPASSATLSFNNRTTVFTQWADGDTDGATPVTRYAMNGYKVTTNSALQTYFVDAALVPFKGGDGSDFLMLQREATNLTLDSETAGGLFTLVSVDLATTEGLHGTLHVTGRRGGVAIATADLVYDENLKTFVFAGLGGDWSSLDSVSFDRAAADGTGNDYRVYIDNLSLTAVPEPATFGVAAGAAALIGVLRRRRRAR